MFSKRFSRRSVKSFIAAVLGAIALPLVAPTMAVAGDVPAPQFMEQQLVNNASNPPPGLVDTLDIKTYSNVIKRLRYTDPGGTTTNYDGRIVHINNGNNTFTSSKATMPIGVLANGAKPTLAWERGSVLYSFPAYINKDNAVTFWSKPGGPARGGAITVGNPGKLKALPAAPGFAPDVNLYGAEFDNDGASPLVYSDIEVWTSSSWSDFTLENFNQPSNMTLLFDSPSPLFVSPGSSGVVPFGSFDEQNQYLLIRANVALASDPSNVLSIASASATAPEPTAIGLLAALAIPLLRRNRAGT